MRDSAIIVLAFAAGLIAARCHAEPLAAFAPHADEITTAALWLFMLLAGLAIGADKRLPHILRDTSPAVIFLPVATAAGTFLGCALLWPFIPLRESLAVGAGFGYYSLSSIFIGQYIGPEAGAVALLANILRELLAIILMPLLVARFGPMPAIAAAGSPSIDTALPAIARYAGPAWIVPAIAHGIALDLSVPFFVTLFCAM